MRSAVAFFFSAVFGIAFAAAGVVLALWVGMTVYRVELGFDWALWAWENSGLPLTVTPLELANGAIQPSTLIPTGMVAAVLCLVGLSSLRSARDALRPAGESSGGKAKLELKTPEPRVGRPLEGSLRLLHDPQPGQVFRVELSCGRTYQVHDDNRRREETGFFAQLDVAAVQNAEGWRLPFRFDVPVTAPASGAGGYPVGEDYCWSLAFYPADAAIAFPSRLPLTFGAAPQEELRAAEARETPEQKAAIEAVSRSLGMARGPLLPHEREQLRSLSPADLAMAQKVAGMPVKIMQGLLKWAFIVLFVLPALIMLLIYGAAMLLK
jgi:hypothetical protein